MKKLKDYYFHKAKSENYPARSVYKLEEIDLKYKILKTGMKILDLGCSPGSWTKYCLEKIGKKGLVVGVDMKNVDISSSENLVFIREDISKTDAVEKFKKYSEEYDVVLSDLAPSTTGIRIVDQERSLGLVRSAYRIAVEVLKKDGSFIVKIFEGQDVKKFLNELQKRFKFVKVQKPKGSRKESFEVFAVCMGFIEA